MNCFVVTRLLPCETAAILVHVLGTPYKHAPVYCEAMHAECIKVMCLAVIRHLHFWQNDRNLLHATTVTWGGMITAIWVSTESWLWRIKCSYWDSNPQPSGHKSSALPLTELSPCSVHYAPHANNHMSTLSAHCERSVIHLGAILCSEHGVKKTPRTD